MNRKRLLFLNSTLGCGGIERSLCDLLRHIDYGKYIVDLYLDSTDGAFFDQLPNTIHIVTPNMDGCYGHFFSVTKLLLKKGDFGRVWLRIVKKIAQHIGYSAYYLAMPLYWKYGKYDYIISYKEGEIAQFARRAFRHTKFFSWWHCASKSVDISEYKKYGSIDKIIAVSKSAERILNDILPDSNGRSCVIPNMVDVQNILAMAKQQSLAKPFVKNLVTVARLSPEKHLDNVISCAEYLIKAGIAFQWHVIGGGLLEENLRSLCKSHHLENFVFIEGEQENPYPYMQYADLYVHTSYIESQGLTILEAMTLGVPCVVTKSLGPCEFIEDGVNGVLAEQTPESLANKVLEILTSPKLYDYVKENTHCPEQFLPENVMIEFEKLLEGKL